jgi:hypothetical protein
MSNASIVEALFFAALEKRTAAERVAFLDSACGGDAELRRQVGKLLDASPREDFLTAPIAERIAVTPKPPDATLGWASTDGPGAGPAGGNGPSLARTEAEGSGSNDSELDFLQPSTRPDSLGRLGHYEILEVLGQGGFGIVFRAFDEQLQRVVAIKVLAPALADNSSARKRFLREARSSTVSPSSKSRACCPARVPRGSTRVPARPTRYRSGPCWCTGPTRAATASARW